MTRKTRRLEELAADKPYALVGGPFGSKLTSADYVEAGVPVIRGTNLTGGRYLTESDFVFVTDEKVRLDLFGNLAHPGDVVFTQRGTLGQVAMIPVNAPFKEYVVSQSQMKLSPDPTKADTRFIYYWFTSRDTVQKLVSQNASSGVPHINLTVLRNFHIPIPDLRTQNAISDVLTTYDDLIENNKRRILLLEESARLLYREWFVHLRFPGHEHVGVTNGVPDGWARVPLGSVLNLQRGFDLPFGARKPGHVPVYGSTGVVGTHDSPKISTHTLITGRSGSLGTVCYVQEPCWPLNTALWVTEFKRIPTLLAYFILREMRLEKLGGGASVPTLDRKVVHAASVLVPTELLANHFAEQADVIYRQVRVLTQQNQKLAEARDLLLPRLISGDIAA